MACPLDAIDALSTACLLDGVEAMLAHPHAVDVCPHRKKEFTIDGEETEGPHTTSAQARAEGVPTVPWNVSESISR